MRTFRSAEDTRPFSEVIGERRESDPNLRRRDLALAQAERLEREALATADPAEARLLQLEAENLRAALTDGGEIG